MTRELQFLHRLLKTNESALRVEAHYRKLIEKGKLLGDPMHERDRRRLVHRGKMLRSIIAIVEKAQR